MLSVVRFICALALTAGFAPAQARDVYILVIGGGTASNCNAHAFGEVRGVYQIGLTGSEKSARDPFELADCKGGSVWIPLGQKMVEAGMADKVVFMPVGMAGTRARDWQPGGRAYSKLMSLMSTAKARNIKFDYGFWQQGSADIDADAAQYSNDLHKAVKAITINIKVGKWIIAQGAGCNDRRSDAIKAAQLQFSRNPVLNRFSGPDTSVLGSTYRSDNCYFNELGQRQLAQQWFRSIIEADAASVKYQKESLLYYFK